VAEKLPPEVAAQTRQEWRELGFFYFSDDEHREWHLIGSAAGLLKFADLLEDYSSREQNDKPSEHDHFGPHMYLEVMTWPYAGIDGHSIHGPLPELTRLAAIVRRSLRDAGSPQKIRIREEYSPAAEYSLVLDVRDDSFDPASADPQLVGLSS
jgi:hypothetical protein